MQAERQAEMNVAARQLGLPTPLTRDQLLQEIKTTMSSRKKLRSHVSRLETELTALEKVSPLQNVSVFDIR